MNAAEAFRLFIDHSTIADKRKGQLANRYLDMACKASEDDAARALLASMTEDERAEMEARCTSRPKVTNRIRFVVPVCARGEKDR